MTMRFNSMSLGTLLVTLLVAAQSASAAPLLKVDFGLGGAASPVQPGFTAMSGVAGQTSDFQTFGAYTVALDGQAYHATAANSVNIAAGVRSLYRDYYYNNSPANGDGVVLQIGGVTPFQSYNLTLWSYDADQIFGETQTDWTPFGDTTGASGSIAMFATPYPTALTEFDTTLQVTSTTSTLDIFGTTSSGPGGTRLNAFRLNDGASDVLSIDFGLASQPPSPVQATYSSMSGSGSEPTLTQAIGAYNVTVEGQGFHNSGDFHANSLDPSVRDFYRDYYYNNSTENGQGVELTIEGVTPDTMYDLTLWTYDVDNLVEATPTTWTPTGDTTGADGLVTNFQTPFPATLADNKTTIRVSSTTSSLTVFGTTTGGTGGTRLNGFQLDPVILGDVNGDGFVDIFDVNLVSSNWGTAGPTGDANGDGTVDIFDINLISAHWNPPGGVGGAAAVPEPAAWVLLVLGIGLASMKLARGGRRGAGRR